MNDETAMAAGETAEHYRDLTHWDQVYWASHCIDCYPGNCPLRAYTKDGKVWREESAAVFPTIEEGVPDLNPMGCQKGMGWNRLLDASERVLYPLKRVGERGEGRWEQVTWEQAATEIADAVLDAVEEIGPESVIAPSGCNLHTWGVVGRARFMSQIGGLTMDVNAEMNDFAPGHYLTYGFFDPVSSIDDWFHAGVILIWNANPVYTRIPHYHFIAEARYKGAEVYTISPDVSPSAVHADYQLPVRPGSDAALALAMAQVVIEEDLVHREFALQQTDLPLLMRPDTGRFLRQSDLVADGSEETFYAWDERTGQPVEAPRGTLFWGDHAPALEGAFTVQGPEGPIETETVFTVMRRRLEDYTPEKAAPMCGLHPDAIRKLARKIAARPTKIICSLSNAGKHYHGDLVERSQLLLLGLTGNWGRKGTGVQAWLTGFFDGWFSVASKSRRGPDDTAMIMDMRDRLMAQAMEADPTLTPALIAIEGGKRAGAGATATVPPVFFWYNHAGYRDSWERSEWHDPSMERPFQEYLNEALEKGWWSGVDYPRPEQTPRVLVECGGNVLRRTRGGSRMLLEHLWPKLNMVVTLDVRMSTTALYSDFVLPIAHQYEKIGFGIPSSHTMNLTFCDRAVEPPGEAVNEWEAFRRLTEKLQERAKARGIKTYTDSRGTDHDLATCHDTYTRNDQFVDEDLMADEMIRDTAIMGTIPEDASLADIRRKGYYRWQGLGVSARALTQATEPRPDETFAPNRNRVEKGEPWPTLTRRAQFLIDHPWFLEADEHLPRHKDAPKAGGDYPFQITSGHNRWSIHSLNTANELMLETHRGTPHLVINVEDAKSLDIEDNDDVRVYNDRGEFTVPALLSASARPGQVIMYNGFEPYQFRNWAGPNDLEPGMIKWLHLAGGYGHLRYWGTQWQPCPVMRNTHVNLEKSQ